MNDAKADWGSGIVSRQEQLALLNTPNCIIIIIIIEFYLILSLPPFTRLPGFHPFPHPPHSLFHPPPPHCTDISALHFTTSVNIYSRHGSYSFPSDDTFPPFPPTFLIQNASPPSLPRCKTDHPCKLPNPKKAQPGGRGGVGCVCMCDIPI